MGKTFTWKQQHGILSSNSVLVCDDFYISYNPRPGSGIALFAADGGGDETALCHADDFYILNGDWRDDYERLAPDGFAACLAFFREKAPKHGSSWTQTSAVGAA